MRCETALRVLLADDRPDVLEALRLLLKAAGHKADTADSPTDVLAAVEARDYDLILMDLNYARDTTSGAEGLDLLARFSDMRVAAPVVVMTAWGSIDIAVEAMRRGACDFVQKPWDNERLLATLEKQAHLAAGRRATARRDRNEFEIAREVQQNLFPRSAPQLETLECAGRCVPARAVGGDYYDFLDLGPSATGLLVADVSGKGTGAALLMANLQGCFRSQIETCGHSPRAMLRAVNRLFCDSTPPEQFATAFFARYEDRTRRLQYVNCGHPPPVIVRISGEIERLQPCATVLGAFRFWECEERSAELAPGDALVVFSDGISEAGIDGGEEFGEFRAIQSIRALDGLSAPALAAGLIDAACRFSPDYQGDDMTVLAARAR
ncbi:MAG TPA: SpoIIE family protein phosphatase [Bryobacteraceae bacterium]|nr:SpoIIE family protein phosphatase [Bryobacteraceae bacterium]